MHTFYHVVALLGAISAAAAAILPLPLPLSTLTNVSNDNKTLNVFSREGINCRGNNWKCSDTAAAGYLAQFINEIPDGVFYSNGQQIGVLLLRS